MAGAVLLVDDDPALLASLRVEIEGQDIVVDEATDAATACAMLDNGSYCGLVLDLVLAEGTGFDVLHHIDRKDITVSVVVITQKLPSYVREMLNAERVKLVFPKPVDARLLASVVMGMCGIAS